MSSVDILVHVPLHDQAQLARLWTMPVGTSRVAAAVTALQHTAAAAQPAAFARIGADVHAVDPQATVTQRGSLWIDDSLLLDLHMSAARLQSAQLTPATLASNLGGELVDPKLIGPGDGTPHSTAPVREEQPQGTPMQQGWSFGALGVSAARKDGLDGSGITVGMVCSGVDVEHPAIHAAWRGTQRDGSTIAAGNYFDPWASENPDGMPQGHDGFGGHGSEHPGWATSHGTWCAGMLVGQRTGVAPGAKLIVARDFATNAGDPAASAAAQTGAAHWNELRALQWMMAPVGWDGKAHPESAPEIISASWGEEPPAQGTPPTALTSALQHIAAAGIVSVFAAGNAGRAAAAGTLAYPADLPSTIAVGGVDRSLHVCADSSTGPSPVSDVTKPDVVAPAVDVRSTFPGGGWADTTGGVDGGFAGTSVAAPQIAGVLALADQQLARQHQPLLDLRSARFLLAHMSTDVGAPGADAQSGAGIPNLSRLSAALSELSRARE